MRRSVFEYAPPPVSKEHWIVLRGFAGGASRCLAMLMVAYYSAALAGLPPSPSTRVTSALHPVPTSIHDARVPPAFVGRVCLPAFSTRVYSPAFAMRVSPDC